MITLNEEQALFIRDSLENEFMDLALKRSKSASVKVFDEIYCERANYMRSVISETDNQIKKER